jgi:hypothetical protein
MNSATATIALGMLLGLGELGAQAQMTAAPAMTLGSTGISRQAPNTLLLGTGTGVIYDSNISNSQPPVSGVRYTVYPQIGLSLAHPRWDAIISFSPGLSYGSANVPQNQMLSLTSSAALQYRASQKLLLTFLNTFVSSTNPFDSLRAGSTTNAGSSLSGAGAPLDYLPRTNEHAAVGAVYSLSARTSLIASGSYNYISYQYNSSLPPEAQPFQQSAAGQWSFGVIRRSSPRYSGGVLYVAQRIDAGEGQIKTLDQSVQYSLQFAPTSALQVSAMIGPECVQSSYASILGNSSIVNLVNQRASGWSWTGSAGVSWTHGKNQFSAGAAQLLSMGNQYQGNVRQILTNADFQRRLTGKADLDFFGEYSINKPVFIAQSVPRLSNNYLSAGAKVSKTIAEQWVLSFTYWYLLQSRPQGVDQLYSGDHNRVAVSLSYSLSKPLKR